ncbi:MAG: Flagellar basal body protein [Eubacteriales bacterium]|jgi:flagellar basal-body rod protein FlgG
MINSFYTAATGTINLQNGIDVTANNVANLATTGYKASTATFSDLLYTNIQYENQQLKSGHGTRLQKTDTLFEQGAPKQTGRALDYCLMQPDAFFAVQTKDGVQYTRNGNFHISLENDKGYLVDSVGNHVLDANGNRIPVESENDSPAVGVFSFSNAGGLERAGNTCFKATALSGNASVVTNPEVKNGFLEDSSVDNADQMVSMIEYQRAFQFNSKIVQISDDIMQTVNSLR